MKSNCMVTDHVPKTVCVTSGSLVSADPILAISRSFPPDAPLPHAVSSCNVSSVDYQDPMTSIASNCTVTGNVQKTESVSSGSNPVSAVAASLQPDVTSPHAESSSSVFSVNGALVPSEVIVPQSLVAVTSSNVSIAQPSTIVVPALSTMVVVSSAFVVPPIQNSLEHCGDVTAPVIQSLSVSGSLRGSTNTRLSSSRCGMTSPGLPVVDTCHPCTNVSPALCALVSSTAARCGTTSGLPDVCTNAGPLVSPALCALVSTAATRCGTTFPGLPEVDTTSCRPCASVGPLTSSSFVSSAFVPCMCDSLSQRRVAKFPAIQSTSVGSLVTPALCALVSNAAAQKNRLPIATESGRAILSLPSSLPRRLVTQASSGRAVSQSSGIPLRPVMKVYLISRKTSVASNVPRTVSSSNYTTTSASLSLPSCSSCLLYTSPSPRD